MKEIKEVTIEIPEGFEIDKENSSFDKIVFKKKENVLPKKWEDLIDVKGYFIDGTDNIIENYYCRCSEYNKNVYPTRELAEATLALSQLLQLRDVYNDGWVADWKRSTETKYGIIVRNDYITIENYCNTNRVLHFKTKKLRDEFFNNFKDLLEIAKPLL